MARFKLIDVGSGKWNGEVIGDEDDVWREARKHLGSRGVDVDYVDETHGIITAGFHLVGRFERVGD